jgi:CBS domain-containing protein
MNFLGHIYSFLSDVRQLSISRKKARYKYQRSDSFYGCDDSMLVKDIMTPNVVTIESGESVLEACKRYKDFGVGCLVVMNNKLVVGILTERDIIERILVDEKNPKQTNVEDIMSKNIKTIHAAARIEQAAEIMKTYKIKKLPVILNNEIVGIVTATDIANNMQNFSKEIKQIMTDEKPFKFVEQVPYKKETYEGY